MIPLLALATVVAARTDTISQAELLFVNAKPPTIKFTAVDGTKFDLAQWRGKVVLVDFWATWCPPCRREVPTLVAAYRKLHDKGFEVVGISLDQSKEQLMVFTKNNGMPWPQYFDGKGWENELSTRFHIEGLPTMWLLDKQGRIRNDDPSDNLEAEITKLLAE
ncbi:MAG: TlpA disulfide reductase family protein [Verrucomicrobiota bacterium]